MRTVNNFELETYFKEVEVTAEQWTDFDGTEYVDRYKTVPLKGGLTLIIFESGQASLDIDEMNSDYVFYFDDEAAAMFEVFDEVRAGDMFELIHRKRWRPVNLVS